MDLLRVFGSIKSSIKSASKFYKEGDMKACFRLLMIMRDDLTTLLDTENVELSPKANEVKDKNPNEKSLRNKDNQFPHLD